MSETPTAARTPIVYFIDDSATMREVIKIAFRKESIHVITCADAASAMAQFGEAAPDAVITDVIMPDKDGYEVCRFIKQHEQFAKTPVILMSGVVNRDVAEKAMAVKADELVRKPFQPQDLIVRVKNLLFPNLRTVVTPAAPARDENGSLSPSAAQVLSGLFPPVAAIPSSQAPRSSYAQARTQSSVAVAPPPPRTFASPAPSAGAPQAPQRAAAPATVSGDVTKLRNEVRRLELLVKKLQAELEAQHQYCTALEAHIKTLQEVE